MKMINNTLVLCLLISLAGCHSASPAAQPSSAPEATQEPSKAEEMLTAADLPITDDVEFNSTFIKIPQQEFLDLGFQFGDSVNLRFSNGYDLIDIPFFNGYYSKPGNPVLTAYPSFDYLSFVFNFSEGSWSVCGLTDKDTATIELNEAGKYKIIQETFSQKHSDELSDYETPEQFCNFRSITGGTLKEGVFYRSASAINNQMKRAVVVDQLIEKHGIKVIWDLANQPDDIGKYLADSSYSTPVFSRLYENGDVVVAGLSANLASDSFKKALADGLREVISKEGPYMYYCTEGKDRTGFLSILLLALAGASFEEMEKDFAKTFEDYYHVTKEKDPEKYAAIIDTYFEPFLAIICGLEEENFEGVDYAAGAHRFLEEGGFTDTDFQRLMPLLGKE